MAIRKMVGLMNSGMVHIANKDSIPALRLQLTLSITKRGFRSGSGPGALWHLTDLFISFQCGGGRHIFT